MSVATAPEADATRFAVPRAVLPAAKDTVPVGTTVCTPAPLTCFTVAVRTVEALGAIAAGLAETDIEVGIEEPVTDTAAEAVELPKLALPAQVAVIVLTPETRLMPLTVSVAVAVCAEP